ncbi:MAG TPA: hypothetical protein VFL93_03860 [Longimicrobiaceae bacterium]|nr:hypothetical protein [Longimicrobiaceae bacterium]
MFAVRELLDEHGRVVVVGGDFAALPFAVWFSRLARGVIRQNLFIALRAAAILLVEAHEVSDTAWTAAMSFLGSIALLALDMA